jgi:hypothetical protein
VKNTNYHCRKNSKNVIANRKRGIVDTSDTTIPNDQTSENIDIVLSRATSGAVHLTATENGFSSRY